MEILRLTIVLKFWQLMASELALSYVGCEYQLSERLEDSLDVLDLWKNELELQTRGRESYIGSGTRKEAYWRTLRST